MKQGYQIEIPKIECRISNKEFRMMKLNLFFTSVFDIRYSIFCGSPRLAGSLLNSCPACEEVFVKTLEHWKP